MSDWEAVKEFLLLFYIAPTGELEIIFWALFLGMVGLLVYLKLRSITLGAQIEALLRLECRSPETAKTAEELGWERLPAARDRLILKTEEETPRFYLPEENEKKGQYFLKSAGDRWWLLLLEVAGLYLGLLALYHLLPYLMN